MGSGTIFGEEVLEYTLYKLLSQQKAIFDIFVIVITPKLMCVCNRVGR